MKLKASQRYSLKNYTLRIFAPAAIFISLLISVLISLSEYQKNTNSRFESQKIILSTFSSAIRQPLLQGSFVEAQIRADELVLNQQVSCVEIRMPNESIKSCRKNSNTQGYLKILEQDLKFSEQNPSVLSHVSITFDNSDMVLQFWKSAGKSAIGFILLSAALFMALNFGNARVRFELTELLALAQSNAHDDKVQLDFKIEEFHSIGEKLSKYMEVTKKEVEAKTALKTARQVAHDIRSPIVSLQMAVSAAQNQLDGRVKDLINKSSQRISDIAEDVLKQYEPVRVLPSIIEEQESVDIELALKDLFEEKRLVCKDQIKLNLNLDKSVRGLKLSMNESDLKRALSNIINNSIQAISEKGLIKIEGQKVKNECHIIISDNGTGMNNSILDRIHAQGGTFEKTNGHGLGLSMVKEVMEKYNGKLMIRSKVNVGTTLSLIFPINNIENIKPNLRLVTNEL